MQVDQAMRMYRCPGIPIASKSGVSGGTFATRATIVMSSDYTKDRGRAMQLRLKRCTTPERLVPIEKRRPFRAASSATY